MDFSLSEEQVMLRNMARQFATHTIEPAAMDDDHNEHFPWEIIKEMAGLGFLGALVPQQHGGPGGHTTIIHFHTTDDPDIAYNLKNNTLYWSNAPGLLGTRIMARNVNSITLEGFDSDGNPVTTPANRIRSVRITLVTTDDKGGSPQTYLSRIRVRNL